MLFDGLARRPHDDLQAPGRRSKLLIGPVAAFEVEARGGKRKVFYLRHDVIRWLEQLQEAAHAEGYRLTQSVIIGSSCVVTGRG